MFALHERACVRKKRIIRHFKKEDIETSKLKKTSGMVTGQFVFPVSSNSPRSFCES